MTEYCFSCLKNESNSKPMFKLLSFNKTGQRCNVAQLFKNLFHQLVQSVADLNLGAFVGIFIMRTSWKLKQYMERSMTAFLQ